MEHKVIPDAQRHPPKGCSTATAGQIMVAVGGDDSSFMDPKEAFPPSLIGITRVLTAESPLSSQTPTALNETMQVTFGDAVNTELDDVQMLADGTLKVNVTRMYRVKVAVQFGRVGASGVSIMHSRLLINGVQFGRSTSAKLSSIDIAEPYVEDIWATLPAGSLLTLEVVRDPSGTNFGGLYNGGVTATGYNPSPCAIMYVDKLS